MSYLFIPGLKLSKYFFTEAIHPIISTNFPNIRYSAARLDWGSDVLGFDTPMSMDHGWGPKMTIFLSNEDYEGYHEKLNSFFSHNLPFQIHGFPTNYGEPLSDGGVMKLKEAYPIHHMITITTQEIFFDSYLGVDINSPLTPAIWLTIPHQKLRTIRSGPIYHDGLGSLSERRTKFHWYPHDLWLYLMANQWQRIDQQEAFVGRTGQVGDDLGSRLITSGLIRDMMSLGMLMAKQYSSYTKWFGTAFDMLEIAPKLVPHFQAALNNQDWKERESHLSQSYLVLMNAHNDLNITQKIPTTISSFHDRPIQVPHSSRFVEALHAKIKDPIVKALPPNLGSINQVTDNVDVLENPSRCSKLEILYRDSDIPDL